MKFERRLCEAIIVDAIALGAGTFKVFVERAAEFVGPLAGDGVDYCAGKIPLADVIRGDLDLDLVDGIQRDRLGVCLAA